MDWPVNRERICLAIERDDSDGFFVGFTGAPNVTCRQQRASSVTGTWSDLATNTAPAFRLRGAPKRRFGATAAGLIEFHDTSPPPGQAFYRTVQP